MVDFVISRLGFGDLALHDADVGECHAAQSA